MVQRGDYDLALVPARSWDDLGVSSLRPLQTPFLVDSDDVVDEIVKGDVAGRLMSGLATVGVEGLGLWPEALRHPAGFGGPLLTLEDFQGATIRAPYSQDVYAMLRALGSKPVAMDGAAQNAAVAAGRLRGLETGSNQPPPGPPATMTADVTFYAKIDTVVANDDVWDQLTDDQAAVLANAAQQTRDWLVAERPIDDVALQALCDAGLGVTQAGPAAVAAIQHATDALAEQMRADRELGPVIDEIEALKGEVGPDPYSTPECTAEQPATDIGPTIDPAVLDGTYRTSFTEEELRAAGDTNTANNSGLWTISLDGGRYSDVESDCTATYQVSKTMIAFTWDPGDCSGDWTARWRRSRTGLRFIDVQSAYAGDRAIWGLHEWETLDR
jgi:TRAP-type C4-dicarboxylate transport system substrate-binding protein